MSLTPPSSHGSGPVTAEDINSESSSDGEVLTSNGDGTASWATPGGGATDGILLTTIQGLPTLGTITEKLVADYSQLLGSTMTSPPLIYPASNGVSFAVAVLNVPDISDILDITYLIYVTDQLGTNTGLVSGSTSTSTPISSFDVDFTGSTATIVGADLSWDDAAGEFTSAAGGIYTALIYVTTGPD